jgi:hypothetical protein
MSTTALDRRRLGTVGRLLSWWRNRREAQRALNEIRALPPGEAARIAGDFAMTPERLARMVERGLLSAGLLGKMAAARHVDLDAARRVESGIVRELEERCTFCGSRGRCARDLADGMAAEKSDAYCPNAEAFRRLAS